MATSVYYYNKEDTLTKISNRFNTNIPTLVRLNSWLKDPNDNHTYLKPSVAKTLQIVDILNLNNTSTNAIRLTAPPKENSIVVSVIYFDDTISEYKQNKTGDFVPTGLINKYNSENNTLEFINFNNIKKLNIEYIPSAIKDYLTIPLVGNGSTSIEDYWETVDRLLGLSYTNALDNIQSKTFDFSEGIDSIRNYSFFNPIGADIDINKYTADYINSEVDDEVSPENAFDDISLGIADLGKVIQNAINKSSITVYDSPTPYLATNLKTIYTYDGKKVDNKPNNNSITNYTYSGKTSLSNMVTLGDTIHKKCRIIIGDPIRKSLVTIYMPCYPESVTDSVDSNYSTTQILGRSEPFNVYNQTGARSIDFTFDLHREMFFTNSIEESRNKVELIAKYIESGVYPDYDGVIAPLRVAVDIAGQIGISGYMSHSSVEWYGPIGDDYKYNMVKISFTVVEATGKPKSAAYVLQHGSYRNSK